MQAFLICQQQLFSFLSPDTLRQIHLFCFNLFPQNKEADGESKKEDAEDTSDNKSNGEKEEDNASNASEKEAGEQEPEKKEEAEEVGNSKESDKEEEEKNSEVELSPSHIPSAPPQETIQGP